MALEFFSINNFSPVTTMILSALSMNDMPTVQFIAEIGEVAVSFAVTST
jgi:hypothetical protein